MVPDSTVYDSLWDLPRCQEDLSSFPLGELDETTRTPSYCVDKDYPAATWNTKTSPEWSNRHGSESSTLETDVYVWRYALHSCLPQKKMWDLIKASWWNNLKWAVSTWWGLRASKPSAAAAACDGVWKLTLLPRFSETLLGRQFTAFTLLFVQLWSH